MSLEDEGVVFHLQRSAGPERHRAGDVGGAAKHPRQTGDLTAGKPPVLAAGIAEIESARLHDRRPGAGRNVMRQSGSGAPGRDGLEAVPLIAGNLRPERTELHCGIPFAYAALVIHALVEPVEELLHGKTVHEMRPFHAGDFNRILDRLPKSDRTRAVQDRAFRRDGIQVAVEYGRIQHQKAVAAPEGLVYFGIGAQLHAVGPELVEGGLGGRVLHHLLQHIPKHILLFDNKIGDYERIVLDVRSPDVQKPRNLVQRAHKAG